MQLVPIEDDVYDYLRRNVKVLGEDASSILRRLLNLPVHAKPNVSETKPTTGATRAPLGGALGECLNNPRFAVERDTVGRFLFILGWLANKHPDTFPQVLQLRGRKRSYFGKSASELNETGESMYPQNIPGSKFWVVTNNDTPKKQRVLADVMRLLGYGAGDINVGCNAIR